MASPSSCSSAASRLSSLQRHLHPSHSCSDYKGAGFIKVSPEVSEALLSGQAVVALQSIIISHEVRYPQKLESAMEVEANVRKQGAVPASIAILDGIPCVGSSTEELARLVILVPKLKRELGGTLHMLKYEMGWHCSVCYWRDWESSSMDMVMKKEEPTGCRPFKNYDRWQQHGKALFNLILIFLIYNFYMQVNFLFSFGYVIIVRILLFKTTGIAGSDSVSSVTRLFHCNYFRILWKLLSQNLNYCLVW